MQILVILGNNFEELEAIAVIDILRRAEIKVVTASIDDEFVVGSHGITVKADAMIDNIDISLFHAVYCPGGPGTPRLRSDNRVIRIVQNIYNSGGVAAAICAAPTVLAAAGIMEGKKATFFPGNDEFMSGAVLSDAPVEIDGRIITGQAAGSAVTFGINFVKLLLGEETAEKLISSMFVHWM